MTTPTVTDPFHAEGTPGADGRRVGVLLSHGFTGSPASIRPWAQALADEGYAVTVPLLPGHGTTWQQLNTTAWGDWSATVEQAYVDLAARCDAVVVGGLSMGGALALWLAARHPEVAGVLLVNPAVASTNKQLLAVPLLKRVLPSMPGLANDIKKPGVDEHGYDRTPLRALASFVGSWKDLRAALPRVTAPLLLMRSAEDHVVDPSSSRIILRTVSSRDTREIVLEDSYHVATLDHDAPVIERESVAFVARVTGAP
ncbi:MAG: alpha/beta fold hydrolase [Nocardioides sp.]|nr:alpha/beta fold hydrolase [Nocardioides sp.]